MSLENAPVLRAGWAQSVVSLARRVALERTVPKNVSAITEGPAMLPQANVIAVQDTRENGVRMSALWGPMAFAAQRPAAVSTEPSATT